MKFCSMFEANYCLLPNGPMCGRVFGFTPTNPGIQRILRDQHHGCNRDQHAVPGVSPCLCLVTLKTGIGLGICHSLLRGVRARICGVRVSPVCAGSQDHSNPVSGVGDISGDSELCPDHGMCQDGCQWHVKHAWHLHSGAFFDARLCKVLC